MKAAITLFLALTFAVPTFADCTNAFERKAQSRAKVVKNLKKAGGIALGTGAIVGATAAIIASGGMAIVITPLIISMGGVGTGALVSEIKENEKNTFFYSLAVVEGAKQGVIPVKLLDKLDKKMSLYSLSDAEQQDIKERIVQIVKDSNASKELCMDNGDVKPMNFKKLTKFIAEKL